MVSTIFATPVPAAPSSNQGRVLSYVQLPMMEKISGKMDKNWKYSIINAAFNGEYFELEVQIENAVVNYSSVMKFHGNSSYDIEYRILNHTKSLNDFLKLYGVKGKTFKVDFKKIEENRRYNRLGLSLEEAPPSTRKTRKKNTRRKKK